MKQTRIEEITSEETLDIRHKVMWPGKSKDYVRLPDDKNGRHFGLFVDNTLISVISLFVENREAQFRKFATLTEFQGKGFGTKLLQEIMNIVYHSNINKLWCNARIDKYDYYAKFGMKSTDNKFVKGGIEYVIMEKIFDN
ncbi:MAG: GNAT family N-acetyltransferase [Bacteroidales bacterium]|nr:GNAT family N-acetyltransferase [Bacteroidales bacterium]